MTWFVSRLIICNVREWLKIQRYWNCWWNIFSGTKHLVLVELQDLPMKKGTARCHRFGIFFLNRSGQTTAIGSTLTIVCKSDLRYRNKKITLEQPLRHEKDLFRRKLAGSGKRLLVLKGAEIFDWTGRHLDENTHFKKYISFQKGGCFFREWQLQVQWLLPNGTNTTRQRFKRKIFWLLLKYGQLLNIEGRLLLQPLEEVFFNETIHFTYKNTGIQNTKLITSEAISLSTERTSRINMTSGQAAEDSKTTTNQPKKRETHFNQYFQELFWSTVWVRPGFWCVFLALKKVCCTWLRIVDCTSMQNVVQSSP